VVESLTVFAGASGDPSEPFWRVFTHIPVAGGETHEIGDFTVTFASADHPVPTVASRWETAGKSFAFTADTGPAGDWMSVAAEVDLLLSEAALQGDRSDDMFAHHLTPAEAGAIARRMRARRLMLTHIPPHLDPTVSVAEAERTYDRAVALAVPGTVHDV
jgi:ribonuclease BN (tRNA processing enzyme)